MHLEIQLALNYLLSNLYNKLPRRRVNLFGEELSSQLKSKYSNHWYISNPNKGESNTRLLHSLISHILCCMHILVVDNNRLIIHSYFPSGSAYRCLKTPTDPLISSAASAVNVNLADIVEHLPADLWIWIDPGEVSYRVGGGGVVRVLWKGKPTNSTRTLGQGSTQWATPTDDPLQDKSDDSNDDG